MPSRRTSRKRALDLLYEADLRTWSLPAVLATHLETEQVPEHTLAIVRGVHRHQPELDQLIETNAHDWTLARMPLIDRNLLRIGIWEILHDPEVPAAVAIDEAVDLAKELSTDDSGRFVNGLLARVAESRRSDEAERT